MAAVVANNADPQPPSVAFGAFNVTIQTNTPLNNNIIIMIVAIMLKISRLNMQLRKYRSTWSELNRPNYRVSHF